MRDISGECCRMIAGDHCTLEQVKRTTPKLDKFPDNVFSTCDAIQSELYSNYYVSQEERAYPLAYVILVHSNPLSLLKFLKVVYRRHNAYCVHYDQKSSPDFKAFIHQLSECAENVIIPENIEDVTWGDASILNAQLNCMQALLDYRTSVPWMYAFNLQGHELPLRTNREMVEMLRTQPQNVSIMESWPLLDEVDKNRLTYKSLTLQFPRTQFRVVALSKEKLAPFSSLHQIVMHKSWCFVAVTPDFVSYSLKGDLPRKLFEFLQEVANAEEYFFATLYNHKGTPGGRWIVNGENTDGWIIYNPPFAVSVSLWLQGVTDRKKYCSGPDEHKYCHFAVGDLKTIFNLYMNGQIIDPFPVRNFGYGLSPAFTSGTKRSLFLNKYNSDTDPSVMDCLQQRLAIQNMLEYYFDHEV